MLVVFASNCRQLLLSCAGSALEFIERLQMDRCRTDRQTRNEDAVCVCVSFCGDSASLFYKLFNSLITFAAIYSFIVLSHVFPSNGQWCCVLLLGPTVRIRFLTHKCVHVNIKCCMFSLCNIETTCFFPVKTSLKQDLGGVIDTGY